MRRSRRSWASSGWSAGERLSGGRRGSHSKRLYWEERALPCGVRGPVERRALARLARIWATVATQNPLYLQDNRVGPRGKGVGKGKGLMGKETKIGRGRTEKSRYRDRRTVGSVSSLHGHGPNRHGVGVPND